MTLIFGLVYGIVFVDSNFVDNEAYADDGIMTLALTSGLTIESPSVSGSAEPGGTAYAKSNVTYSVSDTSGWSLRASYASGKTALSASGGTTISGANGKQGSNLDDNTWGYAWSDSTSPDQSSLYYQTMPAYGSTTTMKTGNSNVSTTGSINIAAKFAGNAMPGLYQTGVLVTLVATPPLVTYTLTYNSNTTDTVSGMPSPINQTCQAPINDSCNIAIPSTTPTRTNYDFRGWSTASGINNTTTNAAGSDISISADTSLYAVWKVQSFTINFDANGGSGAPSAQSCSVAGTDATSCTIALSSTMPTRSGYDFLGWSSTKRADTAAGASSYVSAYYPEKSQTLSSTSPTTLYALWRTKVSTSSGFASITNMQQMTSTICNNESIGATKTLTDTRDNATYTVTKLADGKCWMTQNLRLASGTVLTSTASNVGTTAATGTNYTLPESTDKFVLTDPDEGQMKSSTNNINGAYYSYNAATAGTKASATSGSAYYDICPKGWKLPTKDESSNLNNALGIGYAYNIVGGAVLRGSPNNFVYSGYITTTGVKSNGFCGVYHTNALDSDYGDGKYTKTLTFYGTSCPVFPYRSEGYSIRCIAK